MDFRQLHLRVPGAWRGEEPVVPRAYQTYSVCEKPAGVSETDLSKPLNCQVKNEVDPSLLNTEGACQQLEASSTMYEASVRWIDRQIFALRGTTE